MKIAIINSQTQKNFFQCLKSIKDTINIKEHNIYKFKEKKSRGHTLNYILKKLGLNEDILIVADDIKLTKGWYKKIKKYRSKAQVWGASMLYPNSKKIQDNGYQFIKIKNNIFLDPIDRGKIISKNNKYDWKYTDCVCGCFLFITKEALKLQNRFYPNYGMNRWDELTFIQKAKSKGLRLAVLNHYCYHAGTSTKNNPNKNLSSISYQIERRFWKKLEKKFFQINKVKKKINFRFNKKISNLVRNNENKILFYGAGIFTENLLSSKSLKNRNISITSSLNEETGFKINNYYKIQNIKNIKKEKFNTVIITPSDAANYIYKQYFSKWLKNNWKGKFYKVEQTKTSKIWKYNLNEFKN